MNIEILDKNTYWYKKVKNGQWAVYRGETKLSEHSQEEGAQSALRYFLEKRKEES